ncbi:PAT1 [[Candida] subhashii]|uniref:PAT1 n=1 Tax=[Candida] subhashii TaxID=561895 RepID=A0A8J5QGZ3_9ASCO|nr:PAT1 [[Candida] subhashii]KAG7661929.1 PAT1 [[Candida] subhashii]
MSFFGFDPTAPPPGVNANKNDEAYDFQDTYEGLGELEDDAFNQETFATNTADIRKDFDFGTGTGTDNVTQAPPPPPQNFSYAQVASSNLNDDEFMQDLWGSSNAPPAPAENKGSAPSGEKKILSLEEIEAQLTAIDESQKPPQPQQFPPQPYPMPPGMIPHPQFGGYMMPPGGFMPPPPGQYPQFPGFPQQMPPQFPGQVPPQMPPQQQQQQQVGQQLPPVSASAAVPAQQQPQAVEVAGQTGSPAPQEVPVSEQPADQPKPQKVDLSQFPVLGSKEAQEQQQLHQHQQQHQQHHVHQQQPFHRDHHGYHRNQHQHQHYHQQHQHQQPQEELTPEQQEKAAKRQEKVSRIMRYSGIMNPKDKDFVTRFQLSQIVTEDPYNEDFYAQVFKVIHPKNVNGAVTIHQQKNNSIAQAYLEQSGHRLGGRYKRADVALQRMQQQVQKAVTVAKERPKLTQYAKEGALGKISFGSGKKPRQQLEIISKAAERQKKQDEGNLEKKETSAGIKKYSKKDILSILENAITELMNVESESRTSSDVDTSKLWKSLKVLEQTSSSGDDESEVNPFIQCLNYNKMLKILSRLFKFLNREQILTIVTLIMSNLENLSVIKHGSYTTYEDHKIPETFAKLVDNYSMTFTKVLMNAVLDFKFNEIIGLLVILIEHNNVSFVSTTKIGLTILTTLLSRAELIIGEGTISATDLSEWSSCYDELFTSLESRIAAIFPPHDVDDGSSKENYVWQFLATLSLGGKLSHQRIIVDEVRDEIFGVMNRAKAVNDDLYKKQNLLNNLNMYLVVMGLVADENEIKELQN